MTTDLRIARLRTQYRMPADVVGERARLDRVLRSAIDDELLTAALERAGVSAGEEICVRRVDSMVRLDIALPDTRLAVAWSIALAEAIAECVRDGGPDVVRYRTRYHALVEMACSAARGDLERAWAWRSLRIWQARELIAVQEARDAVVAALADEPRLAPAVLAAVARRGALPLLLSHVSIVRWIALARASLVAWNVSAAVADQLLGESTAIEDVSRVVDASVTAALARTMASSAIARTVAASAPAIQRQLDASVGRSLAVLTMLEREPALLALPHAPRIVQQLARAMVAREQIGTPSIAAEARAAVTAPGAVVADASPTIGGDAWHERTESPTPHREIDRERATTAWGGLLFLLHIVQALDLPTTLLRNDVLSMRSLSWMLHQLAQLIVPLAGDDPAALAFAGLAPGSRMLVDDPPPNDAEIAALRTGEAAIVAMLRERMNAAPDESDAALIDRVAARTAEVIADRTWIDVQFAMSDVRIDVRRAALDLDPGWLPWLGVVVRFVYV